jgi:hypothetical protein
MQKLERQRLEVEQVSFTSLIRSHVKLINGTIDENGRERPVSCMQNVARSIRLWLSASIEFVGRLCTCGKIYIYVRLYVR